MEPPILNFRNDMPFDQESVAVPLLSAPILEAIPDALVAVNQQGVIIKTNSQAEAMFGYTRDELIGQRVEVLVPERQRSAHDHRRAEFHERPKIRRMGSGLDLRGRRRDGSEFPVEISLSPIRAGPRTGWQRLPSSRRMPSSVKPSTGSSPNGTKGLRRCMATARWK
jgi:PAS domain S-box-containing protein